MYNSIKAGFVGFGEINSPKQLIEHKCRAALKGVKSLGIKLITTDVVTDDVKGNDIRRAITDLKKESFDVLILCLAGWIPSHAVIALTSEFKDKPMILWGLAGDITDGHVVTAAAQAGTTALRKVFEDLRYRFLFIYNIIDKPLPLERIKSFALAATASTSLEHAKVGMVGFRDMKLYNTLYDGISLKASFGVEVEFFEMLEIIQLSENVSPARVAEIGQKIKREWNFLLPVEDEFLMKGIAYYIAIGQIAEQNHLNAVSLKDVDGMKRILNYPPALIFMLLADELKLCTIPENDVMGAVTQLIIKYITGQCAAYFEFYEFFEDSILVGVPDYVPAEIVEGKVTVTRAAFGAISGGLLNVSTPKTGTVTLARLSNSGKHYTMHIVTGEAKLRSWEEAGWDQPAPQLPSLEIFLDSPVEEFSQKVSGQHYILAYGDHAQTLADFCYLKNVKVV